MVPQPLEDQEDVIIVLQVQVELEEQIQLLDLLLVKTYLELIIYVVVEAE